EKVVSYLEAALNQILKYRDCFEINLQAEVKYGAEGTVVFAKHVGTGNAVVIKFHKHAKNRDYSAAILKLLNRKFVTGIARINEETIFDDEARLAPPGAQGGWVGERSAPQGGRKLWRPGVFCSGPNQHA
ncbi:hypothetical protein HYH03_019049, partial [Edaphochlamys debaryana]